MDVKAQIAEQANAHLNVIADNVVPIDRRIGGSKSAANRENTLNLLSDFKGSVKVATTQNISLSGLLTIDGVNLSQGDRVLVKNQDDSSQNGIYITSSGSWNRSNDCNSNSKVNPGMFVIVEKGAINADTAWLLTSDGPINLGVSSLSFVRFGGTLSSEVKTEILAGNAINLTYDEQADTLTISADINTEIIAGSGVRLDYNSQAETLTITGTSSHFFTARDNQPPATNFATLDTRNSILVLEFDAATEESAYFIGIIDERWDLSNGINVRIFWMADTATTGNVRWGVQFEKTGTDLDSNSFDQGAQVTSSANGTSGRESVASVDITTIDSLSSGDRYRLRVYRVAADATNDTMTGDAQLIAVEVRAI